MKLIVLLVGVILIYVFIVEPRSGKGYYVSPIERLSLQGKAKEGDSDAAFKLSQYYTFRSTHTPESPYWHWLTRAAELGHPTAQYNLGFIYFYEQNNQQAAFEWFLKSAEGGSVSGMEKVAECYLKGDGIALNKEKAIGWYQTAVSKGSILAQKALQELGT